MMGPARRVATGVALAGLTGCAIALAIDPAAALRGWLVGHHTWLGLTLGALALACIHALTGGRWGELLAPTLDAMRRPLVLLAALLLPLFFDLGAVFPWARPEPHHPALIAHRAPWLSPLPFTLRALLYFGLWIGLDAALRRFKTAAGPALILLAFSLVFAGTDWVMSVETAFTSTMVGLLLLSGAGAGGLAAALAITITRGHLPAEGKTRRDLGNLLLAAVMLTAYCAFSQYLLIWSADLPEENPWYLHRAAHGWSWIAAALAVFYLAVPFFALLSTALKERARGLLTVAALVLVMQTVNTIWLITPSFGAVLPWPELCAIAAIGGAWAWVVLRALEATESSA
ncbi:MAG: hypothetical protein H6705_21305 [Myxococcales bacterium]|nr:hypothetical protein [Myxococcales bacterium]